MDFYKKFFAKHAKLKPFLADEVIIPEKTKNVTKSLIWSILAQQLSTKVALVMQKRFLDLYGGKFPSAETIIRTPLLTIKNIGISQKKAEYIHHVAEFINKHKITMGKLDKMDDEEIIELLTQIKGIGRWSVEMLLIFNLKREDVFALDDLGVQKAMISMYGLKDLSKKELKKRMRELSEQWSPYRSYVCLHMWKYDGFKEN